MIQYDSESESDIRVLRPKTVLERSDLEIWTSD